MTKIKSDLSMDARELTECQKREARLREAAIVWATLQRDMEHRLSSGGFNTKRQDLDLFDAEEVMKDAARATLSPKSEVTKPNAVLPKEAPEEIIEAIVKDTRARLSYADAEDIYTAIYNTLNKEGA